MLTGLTFKHTIELAHVNDPQKGSQNLEAKMLASSLFRFVLTLFFFVGELASAASVQVVTAESELASFANMVFLIMGAEPSEKQALKAASSIKIPVQVVPSSRFAGLKPGLFVLVANRFLLEKDGALELKRARKLVASAYLKQAGGLVPPVDPKVRGDADEKARSIERKAAALDAIKSSMGSPGQYRSVGRQWDIMGRFDGESPTYVSAEFNQARAVCMERYYYSQGELILVRSYDSWDMDEESTAPGDPEVHSFYISGGKQFKYEAKAFPDSPKERVTALDYSQKDARAIVSRAALMARLVKEKPKLSEADTVLINDGITVP